MEILREMERCTGCGACYQKCPKQCVSMESDAYGFFYPTIEQALCIDCGVCRRICPENQSKGFNITFDVLKCKATSQNICKNASSGGTVSTLILEFIRQNGIVYSSGFDENLNVVFQRIASPESIKSICGSKYVQSTTGKTFLEVSNDLINGKRVLFIGTPCQIVGLYSFLGNSAEGLFTVDLLCAGVASPRVYKHYIDMLRNKYGAFEKLNFRDKTFGYGFYVTSITQNEKKRILKGAEGEFSSCVGKGLVRYSCMNCVYHRKERVGDLTVGDYGVEHITDEERIYGVNMIYLNSSKGCELLDMIREKVVLTEPNLNVVERKNNSTPLNPSIQREMVPYYNDFYAVENDKGWYEAYKMYIKPSGIKGLIKAILPQRLYYKLLK